MRAAAVGAAAAAAAVGVRWTPYVVGWLGRSSRSDRDVEHEVRDEFLRTVKGGPVPLPHQLVCPVDVRDQSGKAVERHGGETRGTIHSGARDAVVQIGIDAQFECPGGSRFCRGA